MAALAGLGGGAFALSIPLVIYAAAYSPLTPLARRAHPGHRVRRGHGYPLGRRWPDTFYLSYADVATYYVQAYNYDGAARSREVKVSCQ
jgi:hypothetical protein